MTKLDTSQCQHILSPNPSLAILSTKIWCFCLYFHLVLLLKKNLVLLFVFSSSSSRAISFQFVFKIPFRHFVCFGKIINCTIQLYQREWKLGKREIVWKNCVVFTHFRVFPISTSVDITIYQYGKNVLYLFYNIAQRNIKKEIFRRFRVDIELYQHGS